MVRIQERELNGIKKGVNYENGICYLRNYYVMRLYSSERKRNKVIEKLQVLSDKADDDIAVCEADACQYYDGYGDGLDRAIEIVKRGGRDEE